MARKKRPAARTRTQARRTQRTSADVDNKLGIFEVLYLPEGRAELNAIKDRRERVAVVNVVEKLKQLGPNLPYPHSSRVKGKHGKGLASYGPGRDGALGEPCTAK